MATLADAPTLISIAALYAVSAFAYARLPPWTDSRAFIAFLLPTAAAAIYVLMRLLDARDPVRTGNGAFTVTLRSIVFWVVLFISALHATILLALLGRGVFARTGPLVPRLTPVALGVLLIAVGNLLPRVKPNIAFGIRTARTLRHRNTWLHMHRFAGYVAVGLGFGIVIVALVMPPGPWIAGAVGAGSLAAIFGLVVKARRDTHDRNELAG